MRVRVATLLLVGVACSKQAAPLPSPEVRLATDLPAAVIDTALRLIAQAGGPRAERIAAPPPGAEALVGQAGAPGEGGDVRWESEPYGAIAAAQRGELLPLPVTAADVPSLWRDPGGTWAAVGGRAVVLLVASDLLGDHPVPTNYAALTQPWLKGKVARSEERRVGKECRSRWSPYH